MKKLKVLDLFSGIGGFSLGLERTGGFETVAFCEIEEFAQKVLKKHWPDVPIYEDVRTIDGTAISADIVTGGYPCQPFSTAGKRGGAEDDRHLWPEMYRVIKAVRPRWVIAENVAGHISMGLDTVLSDLESEGYTWWAFVIPACAVDAKHRRDRVWIVANASSQRHGNEKRVHADKNEERDIAPSEQGGRAEQDRALSSDTLLAYATSKRQQGQRKLCKRGCEKEAGEREADFIEPACIRCQWATEPAVGRVANGIPSRAHRLKSLGNAVVPQIPELIGYAILEAEQEATWT